MFFLDLGYRHQCSSHLGNDGYGERKGIELKLFDRDQLDDVSEYQRCREAMIDVGFCSCVV